MSIGLGNIIVQNKKEPAGVSEAESGLHMDGSKARLGGMLLENTDIDIDTKTFFLQWDGGAGAFLIDVFDDKYFFGTIDGSFNLETGFIFKENEAAVKLNGNAAVSARGQAGVGAGIVYEFGDVESVNNGTKITIKDDTETVEITNVPTGANTDDILTINGDTIKRIPQTIVESGTYTPTITNDANAQNISTDGPWQYMRVGNVVTVGGNFNVEAIAAGGTQTTVYFNPPIFSDFPTGVEAGGTAWGTVSMINGGQVTMTFSNTLQCKWFAAANGAADYVAIHFTYLIVEAP